MYIMMPVKCIGEMCIDCPDLSLEIERRLVYGGEDPRIATNDICCEHYKRCELIEMQITRNVETKEKDNAKSSVDSDILDGNRIRL